MAERRWTRRRAPDLPERAAADAAPIRTVATGIDAELRAADEELPHGTLQPAPPVSGWLGRGIDALGVAFAFLFVIVTVIIVFEIAMRYVFHAPTIWVHETTSFLTAIGFLFGGLYALARDKHIRVVLLYERVHGRTKRALNVAISAIGLFTVGFFAWAALGTVEKAWFRPTGELRMETTGSIFNPAYPALVKGFLLLVVLAMALQFVVLIVNYARGRGDDAAERT